MAANWVLYAAAMVVASLSVVYGSEEMGGGGEIAALQMGKPCEAAFDCWRSEPVDVASGLPLRMSQSFRQKRLEVGGGRTKGGRCRCTLGTCQLYQFSTKSFVPCEEF